MTFIRSLLIFFLMTEITDSGITQASQISPSGLLPVHLSLRGHSPAHLWTVAPTYTEGFVAAVYATSSLFLREDKTPGLPGRPCFFSFSFSSFFPSATKSCNAPLSFSFANQNSNAV